MYALRDVTGTIESIPLIAASIMSKKLAIGASHLLLDVKVGSGAFMKTVEQARQLAETMVAIGQLAGLHTVAAITSMDQPLGHAIGNALEMAEAIAILHGSGPKDVSDLCYHEAAELLVMTGSAGSFSEAESRVERAVRSGAAVAKQVHNRLRQSSAINNRNNRPRLLADIFLGDRLMGITRNADSGQIHEHQVVA